MQFNSNLTLFYFLPIALLVHTLLPNNKARNLWLLLSSAVFFSWGSVNSLLFLAVYGGVNYALVRLIAARPGSKWLLAVAVVADVAVLYVFKYLNFTLKMTELLLSTDFPTLRFFQPLGISFLTFTAIAYVVDVYRGTAPVLTNPVDFFLYLSFFPKAGQGPIIRHSDMLPALHDRVLTRADFIAGLQRFIVGFGKKVLIADVLGRTVDMVFNALSGGISPATAWLGLLFYTFQIYYDFSGYTDMAIGLGRMMGFTLPENFDNPYHSKSVSEFWNRWHMTLGKWFKDYIYIPLGGNRKGKARQIFNLAVVWMTTGIWHGAQVHYILWGVYYGAWIILEKQIMDKPMYRRTPDWLKWLCTFFITLIGWAIFRAPGTTALLLYLKALVGAAGFETIVYSTGYLMDLPGILALTAGILVALPRPKQLVGLQQRSNGMYALYCLGLLVLFGVSIICMVNSTYSSFIYFQF